MGSRHKMASHVKVHAILSKWPLTQYCTNLKMAVGAAHSVTSPPAVVRGRQCAAAVRVARHIVMILGAR